MASTAYGSTAGSPGPLERNTPSGSRASTSAAGVAAGTTSTVAERAEVAEHRALDAEVVGDHPERAGADRVGARRGHLGHEVDTVGARLGQRRGLERDLVGGAEGAVHGAGVAEVAGEAAGVDAGDARHAVAPEEGVEVAVAAPAAAAAGQLADDDAPAERPAALVVGRRHAVVADVGVGEGDDLPGVGGVGDDLLVARQHRVEHHLAAGHAVRAARRRWPRPRTSCRRPAPAAPPARRAAAVIAGPRRRPRRARPGQQRVAHPSAAACARRRACCWPGWPARPASTTQVAAGSMTHRLAGRPAATGPPWTSSMPAMAAGCHDSRASTCSMGRSSSVRASARAVSRPSIPGGAWSKGSSFRCGAWGAWSVAMASRAPSASPALTAATSASVRSGGFTLKTGSYDAQAASVRVKWWVVASAVTGRPSARAGAPSPRCPAVDRCWKWTRAPVRRARAMSRSTISSSASAGWPGMPRRLDHAPSCMCPPAASASSSQCWARVTPRPARVLQGPAHQPGVLHAVAVVGEEAHAEGGHLGHRRQALARPARR